MLWLLFPINKKEAKAKNIYSGRIAKVNLFLAPPVGPKITFTDVKRMSALENRINILALPECMIELGPCDYLVATGIPSECVKEKPYKVEVYVSGVLLLSETVFGLTISENFGFVGYLPDGRDICVCLGRNLTLIATK